MQCAKTDRKTDKQIPSVPSLEGRLPTVCVSKLAGVMLSTKRGANSHSSLRWHRRLSSNVMPTIFKIRTFWNHAPANMETQCNQQRSKHSQNGTATMSRGTGLPQRRQNM